MSLLSFYSDEDDDEEEETEKVAGGGRREEDDVALKIKFSPYFKRPPNGAVLILKELSRGFILLS